jgi:hypothetical protein
MLCQELTDFLETSLKPCSRHDEIVSEFQRVTATTDAATLIRIQALAADDDESESESDEELTFDEIDQWTNEFEGLPLEQQFVYSVLVFYHANRPGWDVDEAMVAAIDHARGQLPLDLNAA